VMSEPGSGGGAIWISLGSASGLSTTPSWWRQSSPGVVGTDNPGEGFGISVAAGDVNGDGRDDLAVGTPADYDDHGVSDPTGSATILYGAAAGGLTGAGSQRFTQDTAGVPGASYTSGKSDLPDDFGLQVALADFNGDGKADLAVGAPGTPVTVDGVKHEDAGTVTVLYSGGSNIVTAGAAEITQATSGMPGSPGKGDIMGYTMATGDSNGDGYADLVIYSPGDHYVTVVNGSKSGLSYATAVAFTQSSPGIAGTSVTGDGWGDSLRFESFKGAGPQGLAVGADGKNDGKGSVSVLYGTTSGLTGTGSTYLDQNSAGVPGTAENGDAMGSFFSS
jgi:FG-GAP repeat protein